MLLLSLVFSTSFAVAENQTEEESGDSLISKDKKPESHKEIHKELHKESNVQKHQHHDHSGHGGEKERNWDLIIGGGAFVSPTYIGSEDFSVIPLPYIDAFYQYKMFKFFLNLEEGVGMSARLIQKFPVSFVTGINLGKNSRDSKGVSFLRGTPKLESYYYLHNSLKADFKYGTIWARVIYAPISSSGNADNRFNKTFNGTLFSVDYQIEKLMIPFFFNFKVGASFMNSAYADANYTLNTQTEELSSFKAANGPNDFHAALDFAMFFSEHIGIGILSDGCYLIKSAHKSVFTQRAYQISVGSALFYRF